MRREQTFEVMPAGAMPLVGSTLPDEFGRRGQTKNAPNVLSQGVRQRADGCLATKT